MLNAISERNGTNVGLFGYPMMSSWCAGWSLPFCLK